MIKYNWDKKNERLLLNTYVEKMGKNDCKIGARIHDIIRFSTSLKKELAESQLQTVQLTLPKFLGAEGLQNLNREKLLSIKNTFQQENVGIKVLSCYINPLAEDFEKQQALFKRYVDYAELMGVDIVGTETGTVVSDLRCFEKNHTEAIFKKMMQVMVPLVEYASSKGIRVGIETVKYFPVCDAHRFERLFQAFPQGSLCCIFDPTNLLYEGNCNKQREIFEEFVSMHASRIEVVHFKDFVIEDGLLQERPLYSGRLDVEFVVHLLKKYNVQADIIVESAPSTEAFKVIKNKIRKTMDGGE